MEQPKIYSAISKAMGEIGAIGKNSKNSQQGFMYRGIDAIYNALQPVMVKCGIFVIPEVLEQTREERTTSRGGNLIYSILKVRFHFYADDGSSVSAIVIGEGMDSGDKASNKAMSVAFKYACFEVFCIPTEEMKDPDAETPEPSVPKPEYIDEIKQEVLRDCIGKAGKDVDSMLGYIRKKFPQHPPESIETVTIQQFTHVMKLLEKQVG